MDLDQLRATLGDRYTMESELGRGGMGARAITGDTTGTVLARQITEQLPSMQSGSGAMEKRNPMREL